MIRRIACTVFHVALAFFATMGPLRAQSVSFTGTNSTLASLPATFWSVAVDQAGNVYIAYNSAQVMKVTAAGVQTTVNTQHAVSSVAVDGAGNLYYTDYSGNAAYKRATDGTETAVGSGLNNPRGIAVDASGNVYIGDAGSGHVFKEPWTGSGFGTQTAVGSGFSRPEQVAVDTPGNVYVGDSSGNQVVEVPWTGSGYDTQKTVGSGLRGPSGVAVDNAGNVYAACSGNSKLIKITPAGVQTTLNSTGGAPVQVAVDAKGNVYYGTYAGYTLYELQAPAVDMGAVNVGSGSENYALQFLFLPDSAVHVGSIAVVTQGVSGKDFKVVEGGSCAPGVFWGGDSCILNVTFKPLLPGARNGAVVLYDNASPANALLTVYINGVGVGPEIGFGGTHKAYTDGSEIITPIVGTGTEGYGGDNGPAITANLNLPYAVAVDSDGNLYIADSNNFRIRKVDHSGNIVTVAGSGTRCLDSTSACGDGAAATDAQLNPYGIAVDGAGNLYISDHDEYRIRKVDANTGIITTVAGGGSGCAEQTSPNGDGCAATNALVYSPRGLAVDGRGNLYVADYESMRVRQVSAATGIITTVAGTGSWGYNGDNILATSAKLNGPNAIALDAQGNLYIADAGNNRIRRVGPNGIITTVAGNGTASFSQSNNVPATSVGLTTPMGVAVDAAGDIYFANTDFGNVYKVTPVGLLYATGPCNGCWGVAVDAYGNVYIADTYNYQVSKVDLSDAPTLPFPDTNVGSTSPPRDLAIENLGNAALHIYQIGPPDNPSEWTLQGPDTTCAANSDDPLHYLYPEDLNPGANCIVSIAFAPTAPEVLPLNGFVIRTNNLNAWFNTNLFLSATGTGVAPPTVPTVTTASVTNIAQTTASAGGTVTADGGAAVTARGVCWSTSTDADTSGTCTNDGTGTGDFTSSITGLTAGTSYHLRAYATNSEGTAYGSDVPFTTAAPPSYDVTIAVGPTNGISWSGGSPNTLTPNSPGATISVTDLLGVLNAGTPVVVSSTGNILVASPLSWTTRVTLDLEACGDIQINADLVATGNAAGLVLNPNTCGNGGNYSLGNGAQITLSGDDPIMKIAGVSYRVIRTAGDLPGIATNLAGNYALGANIDASATATWDAPCGFTPIGDLTTGFAGTFDGLGHVINSLTIHCPGTDGVGLFGSIADSAVIRNVGLLGESVSGRRYVGGLVGLNSGTISNVYNTGSVTGATDGSVNRAGGLAGYNNGTISLSYTTATIVGGWDTGGLVGRNDGTISNAYSRGSVTGYSPGWSIGGFAGGYAGNITDAYSTGTVSGGGATVGGFAGWTGGGALTGCYWDTQSSGMGGSYGGSGLSTTAMMQQNSFSGWDFNSIWGISEASSYPFLRALTRTPPVSSTCVPQPAGLVSWWRGEGDTTDQMGLNNGTAENGLTFASGEVGQAFGLNGTNQYVLVGDPIPASLQLQNQLTLSAWIYASGYPVDHGGSSLGLIMGSQYDTTISGATIFLDGRTNPDGTAGVPTGHIHFQIGDGNWHACNSQTAVPLNQWVLITATRTANQDGIIYFNGVPQPSTCQPWAGSVTYEGAWFSIGQQKDLNRPFNGLIDEAQIYNRALDAEEVQSIYDAGPAGMCMPAFSASPSTLNFHAVVDGAVPDTQEITVNGPSGTTLNWTATKTQSWLSIGTTSGTTPATIKASVNQAGLATGTYTDTITVTSPGASGSPVQIAVTLTMTAAPVLSINASSLTFSGMAGGSNPASQSISITNNGSGTLDWSASKTQPWLSLDTSAGTAPSTINASVNTTGLTAGSYTDTITVTATGASGSPVQIPVTVTITAGPSVSLSVSLLSFSAMAGGSNPSAQSISISNAGGGTLSWTAAKTQPWFSLDGSSGTAPSTINASVNTTGLAAGTYTDTLTLTAPGASGSPVHVPVTLTITAGPSLSVSTSSLNFGALAGEGNPAAQSISISNAGGGTLNWTAVKAQPWLVLDNSSGTAPSTINASVNAAGLAIGTYTDIITLTSTGVSGSPTRISVALIVSQGPTLSVSMSSLTFSIVPGSGNPAAQSISITNSGGGTLNWTAAKSQSWLTLDATSGTAPSVIHISVSTAGLAPGSYTDTITFSFGTSAGQSKAMSVTFDIQDFQIGVASGNNSSASITAGDSAVYHLKATGLGGFSGDVSFTCAGLPPVSGCLFNPAQIKVAGSSDVPFTVSIATVARTTTTVASTSHRPVLPGRGSRLPSLAIAMIFGGLIFSGRKRRQAIARWSVLLALMTLGMSGCGGHHHTNVTTGTPAGSYTVTITATAGTLSHTTNLTLTVN